MLPLHRGLQAVGGRIRQGPYLPGQHGKLAAAAVLTMAADPVGIRSTQLLARQEQPFGLCAEKHHATAVAQRDRVDAASPCRLQRLQADLDHRHPHDASRAAYRLGDEQAGLARGQPQPVKQATLPLQGGFKIRALAVGLTDKAGGLIPVAGRQGEAVAVHQKQGRRTGGGLQIGKVMVHPQAQCTVLRRLQQGQHIRVAGCGIGQEIVFSTSPRKPSTWAAAA
jgi:hypothetical protein